MRIVEPVRVERTYVQKIQAAPERVFPLLCPVRESEWVEDWDPLVVYSHSGFAEPDCVFMTVDADTTSIWVITRRDTEKLLLEMIRVAPGITVGKITIRLRESAEGTTEAKITYMYTALSELGEQVVREYTEEFYADFMRYWERTLNTYLAGVTS